MDDLVVELIEEQRNPNGLLLQILSSGYEQWRAVVAVEGPDDVPFYFDMVKNHVDGDLYYLKCGGKASLIKFKEVADAYDWTDRPAILYLCDKDYDDYINQVRPGVWYTEYYSIESFICCRSYIDYAVRKYATGTLTPASRAEFVASYHRELMRLVRRVRGFSAYMCEVRAQGEHPEFDLFGIDKIFVLGRDGEPTARQRLDAAKEALEIRSNVSFKAALGRARAFEMDSWQKWVRGKLALQLARKSYEKAMRASDLAVRRALPGSVILSREALRNPSGFLADLSGLKEYCVRELARAA